MARRKPAAAAPARSGPLDAAGLDRGALDALADGRHRCGAGRTARQGARRHQGQLLLAFRRPPRADRRHAVAMGARAASPRSANRPRRRRRSCRWRCAGSPISIRERSNARGLAIELAIRALARNDDGAARAVQAVDAERLQHVARPVRAARLAAARGGGARGHGLCLSCSDRACSIRNRSRPPTSTLALDALLAPAGCATSARTRASQSRETRRSRRHR